MFGMLDYRAHKLFKLLWLPFRLLAFVSRFVAIGFAIYIALLTHYRPTVQIIISYAAFEVIALLLVGLHALTYRAFALAFTYLIDVVPSHGADQDEALAILQGGRFAELSLTASRNVPAWTEDDTDELVSLMNWRARWFYGDTIRDRTERTRHALQRLHEEGAGQRFYSGYAIKKVRERECGKVPWIEYVIVSPHCFNSLIALVLIVLAIAAMTNPAAW